ncbi:hypothetical protein BDW75DRAFT_225545, partial [Aspergillus navahoensis]
MCLKSLGGPGPPVRSTCILPVSRTRTPEGQLEHSRSIPDSFHPSSSPKTITLQEFPEQELRRSRFVYPGRFVQLQKIKRVNHPPTSTNHHAAKS